MFIINTTCKRRCRNGDEWYRLRSAFQKHISPLQDVRSFLPTANEIISDFVEKCINNNTVIDDFLPLVSRLYLERKYLLSRLKYMNFIPICSIKLGEIA